MELREIGRVRNCVANRREMPVFGTPSVVEIFPGFADALLKIEKHSHLWVMAWIDRGERDTLQVIPRGGSEPHGVFAVRSPARPNPIGLTAAKLAERRGLELHLDLLDFIDGTVVLDVKPYYPVRDLIFSAVSRDTGRSKNHEESLEFQAARFHGGMSEDVALAARLLGRFREAHGSFEGWAITVPLERPVLVDAVMGAARVSLGRGTLKLGVEREVILEKDGLTVRLPLDDVTGS